MTDPRRETLHQGINELRHRTGAFAAQVAPLYVLLNWTWQNSTRPPTVKEIQEALEVLLDRVWDAINEGKLDEQDEFLSCSGGLEAGYVGGGQFLMSFRLEEWVELPAHWLEMPKTDV